MAYENAANYGIEAFKQTNLTMLVEKFSSLDENAHPIVSLDKLLMKSNNVQNDDFYKEVMEKLSVKSFEEFIDKFQPFVYKKVEEIGSGDKTVIKTTYSLERKSSIGEPIPLSNTAFYKMINELYERRKSSGQTRIEFDYTDVSKLLCPEAETKAIKQLRSNMEYNTLELYRLNAEQPGIPSEEKKECIEAIKAGRLEYQSFVREGLNNALLLQLTDAQDSLLKIAEKAESLEDGADGTSSVQIRQLTRYYDDEGNIKIKYLEQEDIDSQEPLLEDGRVKLLEAFERDFDEVAPEEIKSKAIKDLVLSTVSSLAVPANLNKEAYLQRLENCQNTYKESMESLCEAITPLVEKFLGVRALFENTGKAELTSPLVVANCSADELLANDKIKKNFKAFLAHYSKMNTEHECRFWFAVIPAVALGNETNDANTVDEDPFGDFVAPKAAKKVKGLVSAQEAKALMEIFAENEIMVFFNYKGTKNNCLGNFDKEIYKKIKNTITFAGSDAKNDGSYAVCCLPNFTILSERDGNIVINKELLEKEIVEKAAFVKVPGIYLDAAYVAAGMMIGCQDSEVLKNKDLIVDDCLTCVKVDFEDKMVKNHYYSTMARDSMAGLPIEIEEDQAKCKFGFFFSDSILKDKNNKKNANAYVLNARTMKEEKQKYWKLSNVLFAKYVNLCIFDGQTSATEDDIERFKNDIYEKWSTAQQEVEQNSPEDRPVNTMLKIDWTNKDKKESIDFIPVKNDVAAIEINYLEDKAKLTVKVK